jgi:glyoxylase-like metal-dependent hydrolase (beta-lactamase superfamily II)
VEKFQPDGVPRSSVAIDTIDRILELADSRPLVYLPSHDPEECRQAHGETHFGRVSYNADLTRRSLCLSLRTPSASTVV